jgi:hypothetical protein
MINWTYQNQEVTSISDFPDDTYGFVYSKKDLLQYEGVVGRRPSYKLAIKESDWKTYWGSNKELQELVKSEPKNNWERNIIIACPSKKLLTYYETKYLFVYQALENPDEFWNDNILGKFYTKDFD